MRRRSGFRESIGSVAGLALAFALALPAWAGALATAGGAPGDVPGGGPVAATVLPVGGSVLTLGTILAGVTNAYPPYLAALIERDLTEARIRQASGAFDLGFTAKASGHPSGYYDGAAGEFVLEQALPFWGGNVFGGYRRSSGFLADYDKDRTQSDGELRVGARLNLLRDGTIDRRRVAVLQARLDRELADPLILRLHLDLIRAATRAYIQWVNAGSRLGLAEELLRVAQARQAALEEQVRTGLHAPIVSVDNERLVVSRELNRIGAQRRFEAAGFELSLFHRDQRDAPRRPLRSQLPAEFAPGPPPPAEELAAGRRRATLFRPELRRIQLTRERMDLDRRLAQNNLLPNLDVGASVSQSLGGRPYKDRDALEIETGVELKLPLQRREAKGRLAAANASLERLALEEQMARDRVVVEVDDVGSALAAAYAQLGRTRRNVELATQVEQAEGERFREGLGDLLALQIRELATFEARVIDIDALADCHRAMADWRAATAADVRPPAARSPRAE